MKLRKLLSILPAALALAACGSESKTEVVPESSEFVAENPTDPAVPVDLPSTAMTNAPASDAEAATK